jgi:hypothetical protein
MGIAQEVNTVGHHELKFEELDIDAEFLSARWRGFYLLWGVSQGKQDKTTESKGLFQLDSQNELIPKLISRGVDLEGLYSSLNSDLYASKGPGYELNLHLTSFRDLDYVYMDNLGVLTQYNENRMGTKEQRATIATQYAIDVLKGMHIAFSKSSELIDGYLITIYWSSKQFGASYAEDVDHVLCFVCEKDNVRQLLNFDITDQEFIDNMFILGSTGKQSANRVKITLIN